MITHIIHNINDVQLWLLWCSTRNHDVPSLKYKSHLHPGSSRPEEWVQLQWEGVCKVSPGVFSQCSRRTGLLWQSTVEQHPGRWVSEWRLWALLLTYSLVPHNRWQLPALEVTVTRALWGLIFFPPSSSSSLERLPAGYAQIHCASLYMKTDFLGFNFYFRNKK